MNSPNPLDSHDFVSDRQIASKYGLHVAVIRQWAYSGRISHVKLPGSVGTGYLVDRQEIEALLLEGFAEAGTPESVRRAKTEPVLVFLETHTARDSGRVAFNDLYRSYSDWCERRGHDRMTTNKFGRVVNGSGFKTSKPGGRTYKLGMRLLNPDEIADPSDRRGATRQEDLMRVVG